MTSSFWSGILGRTPLLGGPVLVVNGIASRVAMVVIAGRVLTSPLIAGDLQVWSSLGTGLYARLKFLAHHKV